MYGQGKAEAIVTAAGSQETDLDAGYAYSDSITDVPMLGLVAAGGGRP